MGLGWSFWEPGDPWIVVLYVFPQREIPSTPAESSRCTDFLGRLSPRPLSKEPQAEVFPSEPPKESLLQRALSVGVHSPLLKGWFTSSSSIPEGSGGWWGPVTQLLPKFQLKRKPTAVSNRGAFSCPLLLKSSFFFFFLNEIVFFYLLAPCVLRTTELKAFSA